MASKRQADDDSIDDKSTKYPSLIDSEEPSINDLTYNYEIVYNEYLEIEKIYNEHFIKFEKAQIKFEQLKNDLGNIGESKLLLISSIQVIDEMFTIKESIEKLKNQNKNLLERFYLPIGSSLIIVIPRMHQ